MKTPTILLSLTLSLLAGGCIEPKDVGVESDASSGGSSSEGSGASMTSGASETASSSPSGTGSVTTSGTGTATASGTETSGTGGETGIETMATATASESDTDTLGGTESSTGSDTDGGEEQVLCEDSGGIWDVTSCGHYTCGLPSDCDAVVPGCDCGVGSTFVEGSGCELSDECEAVAFSCGPELTCSAPSQFCDVLIPGVKGAETSYDCLDTPDSCSDAYTCGCIGGAGECEKGVEGGLTVTIAAP